MGRGFTQGPDDILIYQPFRRFRNPQMKIVHELFIVIGIHATVHNIELALYVIAIDLVEARVLVATENLGTGIKSKAYLRRDGKTVEPIEKVALA